MPIDIPAFAYAAIIAGGGILGYVESNSIPLLVAGLFFGSVLGYGAYQISQDPTNVAVFLGINTVLGGFMGYYQFYNSEKITPAGVIAMFSAVMIVRTVTRYFSQPIRILHSFGPSENMVLITDVTPSNQFRSKFVDPTTGIQVIKRSQAVDTGFIRSIILAYSNLIEHRELVTILGAVLISSYLSIVVGTSRLFHEIKRIADDIQANTSEMWEVAIANLLVKAAGVILNYKEQIVVIGFAWLPYLAKPSTNSKYFSVLHSLIIFFSRDWHSFSFILLANAHFIFISLRNLVHRIAIIVIVIFVFVEIENQGKSDFTSAIDRKRFAPETTKVATELKRILTFKC